MKKAIISSLLVAGTLMTSNSYAQQTDSLKQESIKHISKELSIDEKKAKAVTEILDQYKQKAKAAANDKSLTEETRRAAIDQLIDEKNSKLKKMLTEAQYNKIVPTTEREK